VRITGNAYRVPARTGSIAERNPLTGRVVSVGELNQALRSAASVAPFRGVMSMLEEAWARPASSAIRIHRSSTCH
jgi:glyceraldehyde 3-phosphate dehydrogenase